MFAFQPGLGVMGRTPPAVERRLIDYFSAKGSLVLTNVPGPQFPLYCLGRRMLEHRPFVPITHGLRIGTAILSYNGLLSFGVTGDYDTASDVDLVARGIAAGIEELLARSR